MTDPLETTIATHLEAWNSPDGPERAKLISTVYSPDVVVAEPGATYRGHSGMDEAITGLQTQLPDTTITRTGPAQTAHDLVTYTWALGLAGRPPLATGRDVLIISDATTSDAATTTTTITAVYVLIDAPDS